MQLEDLDSPCQIRQTDLDVHLETARECVIAQRCWRGGRGGGVWSGHEKWKTVISQKRHSPLNTSQHLALPKQGSLGAVPVNGLLLERHFVHKLVKSQWRQARIPESLWVH